MSKRSINMLWSLKIWKFNYKFIEGRKRIQRLMTRSLREESSRIICRIKDRLLLWIKNKISHYTQKLKRDLMKMSHKTVISTYYNHQRKNPWGALMLVDKIAISQRRNQQRIVWTQIKTGWIKKSHFWVLNQKKLTLYPPINNWSNLNRNQNKMKCQYKICNPTEKKE